MTSKDFTNWLNGYFSALGEVGPTMDDIERIKKKLGEVKDPIDFYYSSPKFTNLHKMPTPVEGYRDPLETYTYPYAGSTINYSSTFTSDKIVEKDEVDKEMD